MRVAVEEKTWTVIDLIKWGTGYLSSHGIDESRLNIELLLSAILGMKRFDLYVNHDKPLKKNELEGLKALLKRRLANEPVQYIIGSTNFYSIDLKTDRRALIPRPETETLAESVIGFCRSSFQQKDVVRILDIGTGSGCVAIAVAKFVNNSSVTAIDKSPEALSLARENAESTATSGKIEFMNVDFLTLDENIFPHKFDVVASNPPYVSAGEMSSLAPEIRNYEPLDALGDGLDGLTFFRKISDVARLLLCDGGSVFVEIGFGQSDAVKDIFSAAGGRELIVKKDLSNIERVVSARFFR
jgi:release factor glutamine methyltransferase